jgi:hypothetical protein
MEITILKHPCENLSLYRLIFTELLDTESNHEFPHDFAIVEAVNSDDAVQVLESYLHYKVKLIHYSTITKTFTFGVKLHFTGFYEIVASTKYLVYRRDEEPNYNEAYLPISLNKDGIITEFKERNSKLYFINLEGNSALLIEARDKKHMVTLLTDYFYPYYKTIDIAAEEIIETIELESSTTQRVIVYVNNQVN